MKILIVNTLYAPDLVGGAEVSTQILAEGLVQAGNEVCVVCATGQGRDRMASLNGVKVYYLRLANLYWPHTSRRRSAIMRTLWHIIDTRNFLMTRKLRSIVRREQPEVLSTSNLSCLSTGIWGIAKRAGIPIVHTTRDYYLLCPTVKMFAAGACCERQCTSCALFSQPRKGASEQVDVVIGVSRYILQRHLDHGFFSEAVARRVISDCYLPMPDADLALPAGAIPLSEPAHRVIRFGVFGRVSPEKGIELVIEQLLKRNAVNWRLLIGGAGHPDYVAQLKAAYPDARIVFLGHMAPATFFHGIDILIVPSKWHEPFGRVTVEAYSYGIPVIGANSGGIPEVIEPNSALIFDPARPHTLREKIAEAIHWLDDPNLKPMLLQRAATFSPQLMIAAYLEVYRDVLEGVS